LKALKIKIIRAIDWVRSQSIDSFIVLVVMIVMAIIMMPLIAGIVVWIYVSRFIKNIGDKIPARP
jgi:hypothetical protein